MALDPAGYSLKWYEDFFTNPNWQGAVYNSVVISIFATLISTVLGTLAALGLSQAQMPFKSTIMALLLSPMIVPLIISAAGMYFFYSRIGLQGTMFGVILAQSGTGAARQKAAELAEAIAGTDVTYNGQSFRIGVAFGVYTLSAGDRVDEFQANEYLAMIDIERGEYAAAARRW